MHHSGPLPLTFEGLEQGLGVKTAKIGVRENLALGTGLSSNHGITILYHTHQCIQDRTQYEIFPANVCGFWLVWYNIKKSKAKSEN